MAKRRPTINYLKNKLLVAYIYKRKGGKRKGAKI